MNKEQTEISQKMSEEAYPLSKRVVLDANHNYHQEGKQYAYLAGFEARDGMDARLREEHKLMYAKLPQIQALIEVKGSYDLLEPIQSLINKIESK